MLQWKEEKGLNSDSFFSGLKNDFILACVQRAGVKFKNSDHEG